MEPVPEGVRKSCTKFDAVYLCPNLPLEIIYISTPVNAQISFITNYTNDIKFKCQRNFHWSLIKEFYSILVISLVEKIQISFVIYEIGEEYPKVAKQSEESNVHDLLKN